MKKALSLLLILSLSSPLHAIGTIDKLPTGEARAHTTNEFGKEFLVFKIKGDGNCGFYALETNRKEIRDAIMPQIANIETQNYVRAEAINYFKQKDIHNVDNINFVGREQIIQFLKERYFPAPKTAVSSHFFLEILTAKDTKGLFDWIAFYKKLNVNIWQWNEGQDPTKGIHFIKAINIDPTYRTIDIVISENAQHTGHFERLVQRDDPHFDINTQNALNTEESWYKRIQQLGLREQDDLALAIALSKGEEPAQSSATSSNSSAHHDDDNLAQAIALSMQSNNATSSTSSAIAAPAVPQQTKKLSSEEIAIQMALMRSMQIK